MRSLLWALYAIVGPTGAQAAYVNSRKIQDPPNGLEYEDHLQRWECFLNRANQEQKGAVARLYDQSVAAIAALENKAIGILQAVAIIAAGATVAITGEGLERWIASAAFVYLVSAGAACTWILIPRPRHQLTWPDVLSKSAGNAEMGAAVRMSDPYRTRTANFLVSATHDMSRALVLTVLALLTFAFTVGGQTSDSVPSTTETTIAPPTTAKLSTTIAPPTTRAPSTAEAPSSSVAPAPIVPSSETTGATPSQP